MTGTKPATSIMDRVVGTTLLAGVVASVLCLGAGLLWQWGSTGHLRFDYELPRTHFVGVLLSELSTMIQQGIHPHHLIDSGIILLLLTPYLRVILSMVYFVFVERNYKYGLITGFVGTILTYSLFLSGSI